jgi:peptidoglycan/xylan/chitin deacetylase (PgdA/CDA1 family)/GT2 family glycosyltransferase
MSVIEVLELEAAEVDPRLRGRALDRPRTDERSDGASVVLSGWAVGRDAAAVAIEVEYAGRVVRRIPLGRARPDLVPAFPDVGEAERAGFHGTVELAGLGRFELVLRIVLADQSRVPFNRAVVQRGWGDDLEPSVAPLVSVVIPCFGQAGFLAEAIESVVAQTYPHLEVVVVDDGSPDNAAEVASRYPGVRIVRQKNAGLSAARNAGLRHTTGAYLTYLDADDRLLPNAIADGLAAFGTHPEAALVAGRHVVFEPTGVRLAPPVEFGHDAYAALLRRNIVGMHAAVMYQRVAFQTLGGFDPSLGGCEDYDVLLRVARRFPVAAHDSVVAEYRWHRGSLSQDPARMRRAALSVLARQPGSILTDPIRREAYEAGRRFWSSYYEQDAVPAEPLRLERTGPLPSQRRRERRRERTGPVRPFGLLYHRIAETRPDPWGLCVSSANFQEHLTVLREAWYPVSGAAFMDAASRDDDSDGTVLVSFDDGYVDNFTSALPILELYDTPATFFVSSGYLDEPRGFWWDELARLLLEPDRLPDDGRIVVAGRPVRIQLVDGDGLPPDASWRAWQDGLFGRAALYRDLWSWLRPLLHTERLRALDAIAQWAGAELGPALADRPLTTAELNEVSGHPLIDVGGHTLTHAWMAGLTPAMQRLEIRSGREILEAAAGRPVDLFAYPFGGSGDVGPDTPRLVAEAGYRAAFLAVSGAASRPDPWSLPRRQVPDVDGDRFAAWLESAMVAAA